MLWQPQWVQKTRHLFAGTDHTVTTRGTGTRHPMGRKGGYPVHTWKYSGKAFMKNGHRKVEWEVLIRWGGGTGRNSQKIRECVTLQNTPPYRVSVAGAERVQKTTDTQAGKDKKGSTQRGLVF